MKEREEKEKAMLMAVSSFSQEYNPLSKIDNNFLDFNLLNFDYLTKKYSPKNPIFMKFLIEEYYPTKRIEKFINSHHSVGLSQVSFVDLFKLYIYYFFQENIGKEIIFPELKIKYDEFLFNKFRINITFKLRNEVYIDPSIGIPLQQGKTILLSPKQLNSHFFDFLIINSNKCYFFGIKNKPGHANAFNRSLIFLLHSSYKFDESQVKEKLQKLKEGINNFMVSSDDIGEGNIL